jgi:hypothetical protein
MKSSTEDITAKIDQTEVYVAASTVETFVFSIVWTIAIPVLFGLYTYYNGFNGAAFVFMVLGLGWGCAAGAHSAYKRTRQNWFRKWPKQKKLRVRLF